MAGPHTRDKAGRPVVAITGMGVVTSLGVGKSDNWAKLTAGTSGIRRKNGSTVPSATRTTRHCSPPTRKLRVISVRSESLSMGVENGD